MKHLNQQRFPGFALLAIWAAAALRMTLLAAVLLGLYLPHLYGWKVQAGSAFLGGILLGSRGWRKNSLDGSGAVAAWLVGWITMGCSFRLGFTLLAFYFASTKLTKWKEHLKESLGLESHKPGGQRDWLQVLSNAGAPAAMALVYGVKTLGMDQPLGLGEPVVTWLLGAYLGYFACCCGDTWASEVGVLAKGRPRLITDLRPVRPGTNGGVTWLGLGASLAGGLFMGLAYYLLAIISPSLFLMDLVTAAQSQYLLIPLGGACGLVGSLIDSLLGATLQFTGYSRDRRKIVGSPGPNVDKISGINCLSNNVVNFISASITSLLCGVAVMYLFPLGS